ncbi:hypothetical protein A0H81_09181 [Grifola frondosa]|uniref:Uncharacterized protein n=1 Tax=Grifola frondosa TaxID=5627 RepID=A0A1C7M173_GRIFR|nr:hypothetical protein A0H81_09181 [Grifola frondosa]
MSSSTSPQNIGPRPASPPSPQRTLDSDIALLTSLLEQNGGADDDDAEMDVAELLQRLDTADGIARGMESRLDGIIEHLDHLLGALEAGSEPLSIAGGDSGVQASVTVTEVVEEIVMVEK